MVVMVTLPCCRDPAGTTMPEGFIELETDVRDGEEVCRSSWGGCALTIEADLVTLVTLTTAQPLV